MHAEPHLATELARADAARGTRVALMAVACLIWALAVFWPTAWSMVRIWSRSETFAHGFLVIPIVLWLLWERRAALAHVPVRPFWPGLAGIAAVGFAWLLAELASALAPAQFAVIAMVPLVVLTLLGREVLKALAFPLLMLLFAVPFGELFVPTMMDWTADVTTAAIRLSGVPVYREGNEFVIPSGRWSVVEACAGLRYLIASFMVGVLFAWLTYRSAWRRAAFVAASIVVPLAANWARAYGIVMLGHLSDNRIAAGVDHIIYGWIFFGGVMLALFWIGSLWREDKPSPPMDPSAADPRTAPLPPSARPGAPIIAMAVLVSLAWPMANAALTGGEASRSAMEVAPIRAGNGWHEVTGRLPEWRPDLDGPSGERTQLFEKDGRVVGIYLGFYRDQKQGAELVNDLNQLARTKNRRWTQIGHGEYSGSAEGVGFPVRTAVLRGAGGRLAAWHWYWIDGRAVTSDVEAKVRLAFSRLLGRSDASAWVTIYTPTATDEPAVRGTLESFAGDMRGSVDAALTETAGR